MLVLSSLRYFITALFCFLRGFIKISGIKTVVIKPFGDIVRLVKQKAKAKNKK